MKQTFEQYLSAAIVRGTRKQFSRLHADYLEIQMGLPTRNPSCTTTGLDANDTRVNRIETQVTDEANAAADGTKATRSNPDLSSMGEASQPTPIVVKPVDRKTITGSYPGDSRSSGDSAKAAMDSIANPPAPREQMRGQQNSRNYNENGKGFKSTSNSPDSDAGN
jgi:hypothetical protein